MAAEDAALPKHLQVTPEKKESELARLIRLGMAPTDRLAAIAEHVLDEAQLEEAEDDDPLAIQVLLARYTPEQVADLERSLKSSQVPRGATQPSMPVESAAAPFVLMRVFLCLCVCPYPCRCARAWSGWLPPALSQMRWSTLTRRLGPTRCPN